MGTHVSPILNFTPIFLPTPSLWVVAEHQLWGALESAPSPVSHRPHPPVGWHQLKGPQDSAEDTQEPALPTSEPTGPGLHPCL